MKWGIRNEETKRRYASASRGIDPYSNKIPRADRKWARYRSAGEAGKIETEAWSAAADKTPQINKKHNVDMDHILDRGRGGDNASEQAALKEFKSIVESHARDMIKKAPEKLVSPSGELRRELGGVDDMGGLIWYIMNNEMAHASYIRLL